MEELLKKRGNPTRRLKKNEHFIKKSVKCNLFYLNHDKCSISLNRFALQRAYPPGRWRMLNKDDTYAKCLQKKEAISHSALK